MLSITHRILRGLLLSTSLAAIAVAQVSTGQVTSTSMASYGPIVAPDSIGAGWGTNLATSTTASTNLPLPTTLGNTQVTITDSAGNKLAAPLFMVSPGQINYLVPANTALGKATVTVTSGASSAQGTLLVSNVAPGIFTANGDGKGVPAAQILRVRADGTTAFESPFRAASGSTNYTTSPINLTPSGDRLYLILFGSGIRRHSPNPVIATIGGVSVPVLYAGPQSQFPGVDQINLGPLPSTLAGKGEVDLMLTVDGVPANTVRLAFQ